MFENVPTVTAAERQQVLGALERLQAKLVQREEWSHSAAVGSLRGALQSPLFNHILTLQHSIKQLRNQLSSLPPDAAGDFSFSKKGQLIVSGGGQGAPLARLATDVAANGSPPAIRQALPPDDLQKWILAAAKGRLTQVVQLSRPLSGGLGFSVVGLSPAGGSSQVLVKHIQPGGVAHRDGRLREKDQLLVINRCPLEAGMSHQQALLLLQQPGDTVELVVARDNPISASSPRVQADLSTKDQWGQVEEIQLVNDGSGLGFGIVGGRSSGVVVRTLLPNSVADKDGRLRTGDHILRIGATPTSGLTSDQVVKVLQACGSHVTMLIARDPQGERSAAGVSALPPPPPPESAPVTVLPPSPPRLQAPPAQRRSSRTPNLEGYEIHEVPLTKKEGQSLGISIIGYNPLTSQDAVGVFVKHVVPGSAAEQSGNIRVHDRLIALDGISLHGLTNQEVLEVMRRTGPTVVLSVVRKRTRGQEKSLDKVEREPSQVSLRRSQEVSSSRDSLALEATRAIPELVQTSSVAPPRDVELRAKWESVLGPKYKVLVVNLDPVIEDDEELQRSSKLLPVHTLRLGVELDSFDGHHYISSVLPGGPVEQHGLLRPEDELLEVNDVQLYGKSRREVVSFLKEVPPPFTLVCCRHPASFDLLQHPEESESEEEPEPAQGRAPPREGQVEQMEVQLSSILSREKQQEPQQTAQEQVEEEDEEEERSQQEEEEEEDEDDDDEEEEDEEGELALWSPEVHVLELQKEEGRGLGFSILDYQDPLDPGRCVMVVRSLVPGGAAERHGGLLPGDQLVWVEQRQAEQQQAEQLQVEQLSLAQAVQALKAVPPGPVHLGIRKPLVEVPERSGRQEEQQEKQQEEEEENEEEEKKKEHHTQQLLTAQRPHLGSPSPVSEEPELILDGGLPRYTASSSMTSDLLPPVEEQEGREMPVDEEAQEEEMQGSLSRRPPPPSWEEWRLSTSRRAGGLDKEQEELWRPDEGKGSTEQEEEEEQPGLVSEKGDSRDMEADSELTLTDTDTECVRRLVDREKRRKRSQGLAILPIIGRHSDLPERGEGEGEETPAFSHWAPPRRVEVWPEEGQTLGLSIVGGRHTIKRLKNGEELRGIFIKQVVPGSPAALSGCLKTGDKILEVSGVDLQAASHEEAVEAIKSAPSPVVFVVQSLSATPRPVSLMAPSYNKHRLKSKESQRPCTSSSSTLPLRQPPPYRPPNQSEDALQSDLEQARGLV